MNHFELLLLIIVVFAALLVSIRSKWFDRLLDWAFKANKAPKSAPETPKDTPPSAS